MPKKIPKFKLMSGSGKSQLFGIARILARQAARDEFEQKSQQPDEKGANHARKSVS